MIRRAAMAVCAVFVAAATVACSDGAATSRSGSSGKLVVYSGRNENLVGSLFERFEKDSGVDVEVRYGDSAELAAQLLEEGTNRKADVFFSQDAGALGALSKETLLEPLSQAALDKVPAKFRAKDGTWTGVSGRARVVVYNPNEVPATELPKSVFELTDPKWKDRVGIPPTNASFQAFVTAMRVTEGDAKTKAWLTGIKANAKIYDGNGAVLDAVDKGEVAVGLVNHYYLYERIREHGADKVTARNHYVGGGDPGALVNVAGVGILKGTGRRAEAEKLVSYLLGPEGQRYFGERTAEYPLADPTLRRRDLPALDSIDGPDIDLTDLASLKETLALLGEVGLT